MTVKIEVTCPCCKTQLNVEVPLDRLQIETEEQRPSGRSSKGFFPPMRMQGDTLRVGGEE